MILFFILFFGFLSAYRILFFEKNNFIVFKNQKISTKNVTLVFFTLTFLLFFPLKTVFLLFFIFCTLLFLYFLVQRVWKSLKDKRFEKFFVLFLDQVILFVQCGDSFRSAFKSSIKFVPELFHQELQEMYERVTFSQQIPHFSHSQLKKHLLSKLISIDKGKENPLSALKNLRTELHLASLFRHKSMQITASARFQCGILCFLYLSLLFFVLSRFSWVQNRSIISLSILIFCTSLIVFYFLGRKSEWKV